MKTLLTAGAVALTLAVGASPALAHDRSSLSFGFSFGTPGYYYAPPPPVTYYYYDPPPAVYYPYPRYRFVPPGHRKHWRGNGNWKGRYKYRYDD